MLHRRPRGSRREAPLRERGCDVQVPSAPQADLTAQLKSGRRFSERGAHRGRGSVVASGSAPDQRSVMLAARARGQRECGSERRRNAHSSIDPARFVGAFTCWRPAPAFRRACRRRARRSPTPRPRCLDLEAQRDDGVYPLKLPVLPPFGLHQTSHRRYVAASAGRCRRHRRSPPTGRRGRSRIRMRVRRPAPGRAGQAC